MGQSEGYRDRTVAAIAGLPVGGGVAKGLAEGPLRGDPCELSTGAGADRPQREGRAEHSVDRAEHPLLVQDEPDEVGAEVLEAREGVVHARNLSRTRVDGSRGNGGK